MSEPAVQLDSTTATTPEQCDELLIAALNAGDVEAALALYEPGGVFIPEPGQIAAGKDAIREVMEGFVALSPNLDLEVQNVSQSGDIALLRSHWNLTGTDPDGNAVEITGNGTEVVRRQPTGEWLFVIDSPYDAD